MMMESELHRLASFISWPHDLVSPSGLARHGLSYDAKDDRLMCFSCKSEFRIQDDPHTKHRERAPNCEHLRNTACNTDLPLQYLDYCNSWSPDIATKERNHRGFVATDDCGTVSTARRCSRSGECEQNHELPQLIELYIAVCTRAQKNGLFSNVSNDTRSTEHVGCDSSLSDRCNINVETTTSASELHARSGTPQIILKESATATAGSSVIPEIEQISIAADPPKYPQFANNSTRVESFRRGIVGQGQTSEGLAEAGWFYVGPNDKVRCFQCGGNLRDWEEGDDPWTEHRRWYDYCLYVKTNRPTSRSRVPENSLKTIPSAIVSYRIEPREVKARMDTPTVRAILGMGYSRDKVRAVIETRLSTTGDDFPNAESLLEAIFQLEETTSTASTGATSLESGLVSEAVNNSMFNNSSPPYVAATPNHYVISSLSASDVNQPAFTSMPSMPSSRNSLTAESSNSMPPEADATSKSKAKKKRNKKRNQAPASSASTANATVEVTQTIDLHEKETPDDELNLEELPDEESMKYLEENRQLREQRTCKVCMDAEVNTVFLPCGHLVCCATCSPNLSNCPICRTFIRGTVKTFLS